jgi:hypothetical protein
VRRKVGIGTWVQLLEDGLFRTPLGREAGRREPARTDTKSGGSKNKWRKNAFIALLAGSIETEEKSGARIRISSNA